MLRTELMQKGRFVCRSEHCGRKFIAVPGLESTCPECGSSEIELLNWLDDGRLVHLTVCGSISVKMPKDGASADEQIAERKRLRQELDEIIATLPPARTHRYDRADGVRGGHFPNAAIAVAELL